MAMQTILIIVDHNQASRSIYKTFINAINSRGNSERQVSAHIVTVTNNMVMVKTHNIYTTKFVLVDSLIKALEATVV